MELQVENTCAGRKHREPAAWAGRLCGLRPTVCQLWACSSLRGDEGEAESCPPEAHRDRVQEKGLPHRKPDGRLLTSVSWRLQWYLQMVQEAPKVQSRKQAKSTLESKDQAPTGQAQEGVPGQEVAESVLTRTGVLTTVCVRGIRDRPGEPPRTQGNNRSVILLCWVKARAGM